MYKAGTCKIYIALWKRNSTTYAWTQQRDRLCRWNIKNGANEIGTSSASKNSDAKDAKECAFLLKFLSSVLAHKLDLKKKKKKKQKKRYTTLFYTTLLTILVCDVPLLHISVSWWVNFIIHVVTYTEKTNTVYNKDIKLRVKFKTNRVS